MIKSRIDQDLKEALLAGDKARALTLRGLKSVILYAEVSKGAREQGLPDPEILELLTKEAKKRQESADLYLEGGSKEKAELELSEKAIIETYLPAQLSDEELEKAIEEVVNSLKLDGASAVGQVIGTVKNKTAGRADGSRIARMVKSRLSK